MATVVGTALALAALWLLILAGWWLTWRLLDPLLERSRDSLRQEWILRRQANWEQHRQALARQRNAQRRQVVDLDGQVRWLLPEEISPFLQRCWRELELAEGSPWSEVRRQWRRRSLHWHPDHGGDPSVWLRKQRAYEALKRAKVPSSPFSSAQAAARQLSPRRRRGLWRGLRHD